jgi:hypothetical protein
MNVIPALIRDDHWNLHQNRLCAECDFAFIRRRLLLDLPLELRWGHVERLLRVSDPAVDNKSRDIKNERLLTMAASVPLLEISAW